MDKENMVYILNAVYLSIKKEIMSFVGKWMELELITLSEINQTQKDKHCMFSLICEI
jgi:hypothetical protein